MTKVFQFGTLPARIAPVIGEDAAHAQLKLAQRLWNTLVAIERTRVDRYHRIMRDENQARIEALRESISALRQEIKARRQTARKRSVEVADIETALSSAREELRGLVEAQKATAKERHDARRAELDALGERTKHRVKRARQAAASMGLFWGTYNDIVSRADTARKAGEPKFRRFSSDGTLTAQIMGGAPVSACSDGGHGFFQISERYAGNKGRYARMRIGSDAERKPVWLEIPIVYHRPVPNDAVVKSVSMTRRDGRWSLNVTVTMPEPEARAEGGAVAVDIGWRLLPDGVRVAYWCDTDGKHGQVVVPARDISGFGSVESLRSICDRKRDEFLPALAEWLKLQTLPEEWQARSAAISQWRSSDRLAALARWWSGNRIPGDDEMHEAAVAWRKQYRHVSERWRNLSDNLRLRVREKYRVFGSQIAQRYSAVVLEKFDLREVAEKPPAEGESGNQASSGYRQIVSPSVFRGALRNASLREGLCIVEVPGEYSTRTCHACGSTREWDQAASIVHRCECGAMWDQDHNAAINLLRRGLASGAAAATPNQSLRERKWDRVRRLSQERTEGVDSAVSAG